MGKLTSLGEVDLSWRSWSVRNPRTPKESRTPEMPIPSSDNSFPSELRQKTHEKLLTTERKAGVTAAQYARCIEILAGARPKTRQERRYRSLFQYDNQSKVLKAKTTPTWLRERIVISRDHVYQTVAQEHLRPQLRDGRAKEHCGQKPLWQALSQKYYGISRADMTMVLKDCQFVQCKRYQIEYLHSVNRQACSRCQPIDDDFIQQLRETFNRPLPSKYRNSVYDVDRQSLSKVFPKVRAARLHCVQQAPDILCLTMQEAKLQLSQDGGLHKPILIVDRIAHPDESSNLTEFFENFIDSDKVDVQDPSRKPIQGVGVQWSCQDVKSKVKAIRNSSEELPINCLNLRSVKVNPTFDCLTSTQAQMLADLDAIIFSGAQAGRDIISCTDSVVRQYLDRFYLFTAVGAYPTITLPHQYSMGMNTSFDVEEGEKIILVPAGMSDEDWKKFGEAGVNYWDTEWVALKLTKGAKFLLDRRPHIVLSTKTSIVHCSHFVFYSEVRRMITAMLFEEDHPDTTNDGGSGQRRLFASGIDSILANKPADRFGGLKEVKEWKKLLSRLKKRLKKKPQRRGSGSQ